MPRPVRIPGLRGRGAAHGGGAGMRLDRALVDRGVGSRSEVRAAIARGRVRVDGQVATDPAHKLGPDARIELDGAALARPPGLAIAHKPVGVQCTVGDPRGRPSLAELVPDLLALGLHPVGRLDADSEGLLPFSRDGALTQRLLHPRHGVEKEYVAQVDGVPPPDLGERLAAGVRTAEGVHTARLISVDAGVRLVVTEGKHRMVRRMLANLGLPVLGLRRVRFGALELGDLSAGAWRVASPAELAWASRVLRSQR